MEIKTVWHLKNLFKTFMLLISLSIIESIIATQFNLSEAINFAIGFATGVIVVIYADDKWPAYHFE